MKPNDIGTPETPAEEKDLVGITSTDLLAALPVGSRIWFKEEKRPYKVRAADGRFLVCTKPFKPRKTVLYCIQHTETMTTTTNEQGNST